MIFLLFIISGIAVALIIRRMFNAYQETLLNNLKHAIASYRDIAQKEENISRLNKELEREISRIAGLYESTKEMSGCLTIESLADIVSEKLNALPKNEHSTIEALASLQNKRIELYQQVLHLSIIDSLTGIYLRRHFLIRCSEEIARAKKYRLSLSLLMLDIDHFKEVNDQYGHLVGDAVLKEIANVIVSNLREIDLPARYGGEEFIIALIDTSKDIAELVAERIRKAIEAMEIRAYDELIKTTISIGISTFPGDGDSSEGLIESADRALYQAKQAGRNRVVLYTDDHR